MSTIDFRAKAMSVFGLALMLQTTSVAQSTQRVSVSSSGVQANAASFGFLSLSNDGRFVAFADHASNLVAGDTNGYTDVFVRDVQSGTTERVSVSSTGTQGNTGDSVGPAISADGRYVAFLSEAVGIVPGIVIGHSDVFVHDRVTGTTEIVDVDSNGVQANGYGEYTAISADGRYVAFISDASNLVTGDTNTSYDVFVHDRTTGATERVSVDSNGAQGNGQTELAGTSMSADGRYVAFCSFASNLVPGDTNGRSDAFVHDRQTGTTERVSIDTAGVQGNQNSGNYGVSISADGRFVAFMSFASNLVAGDTNATWDVFLRDRLNGTTELISLGAGGVQGNAYSGINGVSISNNGRYVAFDSHATNMAAGGVSASDVYVRDRQSAMTERISVDSSGITGNLPSYVVSLSGDGRFVAFVSQASNLVAGDTNGAEDVFLRDRLTTVGAGFCFGDGSGTACPCGNASALGSNSGCLSSLNVGALLVAYGTASLTNDDTVLHGASMPNSSALYFQGTTQQSAGLGSVFGDGLRCAAGSIVRLGTTTNSGGSSQYPFGVFPAIHIKGNITSPGTRTYQVWYRNAAAFCTPSTFNLTNGLELSWVP